MKIVVADKIVIDNYNRKRLEEIGQLIVYENDTKSIEEVVERLHDADIGIILFSKIDGNVLKRCKKLKMLSLWCTGFEHVDLEDANRANVSVCNVPEYASVAVSEHVFAMLLSLVRHIPQADKHMRNGYFNWNAFRGFELCGKVLGIYGTGAIGSRIAKIGNGFGMKVIATSRTESIEKARELGLKYVKFDELLRLSDVLTVNCSLTRETRGRFSTEEFSKMKPSAIFINTSRGGVVDYDALTYSLKNRIISGACIDVFPEEPPKRELEILKLSNVILTPHIAYNTNEAIKRCTTVCVDNVINFFQGNPSNVINKPKSLKR